MKRFFDFLIWMWSYLKLIHINTKITRTVNHFQKQLYLETNLLNCSYDFYFNNNQTADKIKMIDCVR